MPINSMADSVACLACSLIELERRRLDKGSDYPSTPYYSKGQPLPWHNSRAIGALPLE